jgi:hypothetical protein
MPVECALLKEACLQHVGGVLVPLWTAADACRVLAELLRCACRNKENTRRLPSYWS